MKTIYHSNGAELAPNEPFVLDGVAYASNWLQLASADELTARGITTSEFDDTPIVIPSDPAPNPQIMITPRQARLALFAAGLLDQVEAAVEAAGGAVKISWEYATMIDRKDPLILSIGPTLGLTDDQIDLIFAQAATL